MLWTAVGSDGGGAAGAGSGQGASAGGIAFAGAGAGGAQQQSGHRDRDWDTRSTRAMSALEHVLHHAFHFDVGLVEKQGRYTHGLVFQVRVCSTCACF